MLEPGLTIIDGGKELVLPSGRVDITAQDRNGTKVVIELKFGRADRYAVAQLLSYMGDLAVDGKAVRGILVAEDFDWGARSVARAAGAALDTQTLQKRFLVCLFARLILWDIRRQGKPMRREEIIAAVVMG